MKPDPIRRFRPLPLLLLAGLLSAGCTTNFAMPWDENLLDPARIATREPLEVPPDLELLPEPVGQESAGEAEPSAGSILFNNPTPQRAESLDRHQQETLPDWMDADKNPAH